MKRHLKLILIGLVLSGCTKTIHVYHHFPETIYIDGYLLHDYVPESDGHLLDTLQH